MSHPEKPQGATEAGGTTTGPTTPPETPATPEPNGPTTPPEPASWTELHAICRAQVAELMRPVFAKILDSLEPDEQESALMWLVYGPPLDHAYWRTT